MYPAPNSRGSWRGPPGPPRWRPPLLHGAPPPTHHHQFPAAGRGPPPQAWRPPPDVPPPVTRYAAPGPPPEGWYPPRFPVPGPSRDGWTPPSEPRPPPAGYHSRPTVWPAEDQRSRQDRHRSSSIPSPPRLPAYAGHRSSSQVDDKSRSRKDQSRESRSTRYCEEEYRRSNQIDREGSRRDDKHRSRRDDDRLRRARDGYSRRGDDQLEEGSRRPRRENNLPFPRKGQLSYDPINESNRQRDTAKIVSETSKRHDRPGRSDRDRSRKREESESRLQERSHDRLRRGSSKRSRPEEFTSRSKVEQDKLPDTGNGELREDDRRCKRARPDDNVSESDASERSSRGDRLKDDDSREKRPRKSPNSYVISPKDLVSDDALTERDIRFAEEEKLMKERQDMISKALEDEKLIWTRSSPADPFYERYPDNMNVMAATQLTVEQCKRFKTELVERKSRLLSTLPPVCLTPVTEKKHVHKCGGSDSDDTSSESSESEDESVLVQEELERKSRHPYRLHNELWYNEFGKMNVGDVCRCSIKARKSGIRHNIYAGEDPVPRCDPHTNNANRLFHYRVLVCPPTNFLVSRPTSIMHDGHEFIFEGFSLLSHYRLTELPPCHIIRFNIEYTAIYMEEKLPDNFVIEEVELFSNFLFESLLEMVDLDLFPHADKDKTGCPMFHIMPRFVRDLANNGKEILALNEVISYLLKSDVPLVESEELEKMAKMAPQEWQNHANEVRGMLVTHPARKPSCIRLDQLDREVVDNPQKEESEKKEYHFPEIVHFGIRPPQLSYAGDPEYQKAFRECVKYRRVLANLPKLTLDDRRKLASRESQLQSLRLQVNLKRDVTATVSCEGFRRTGLMADVVQHALFLPVLICHLRFHKSLDVLEKSIDYKFKNRSLLQLALTHPSYRENHGTNRDHSRNSLSNCGIRQPEYGDRCIHYTARRKRGLNILINIMSQFGKKEATESRITHNERLEFLGDAVVEFLTSIHLFFMFPNLEEGGLATYRAAIVQNQHLAVLAGCLGLHDFLLYGHGSDICHDLELKHAMANCFEALMGALFLDAGIEVADKVFSRTLFKDSEKLLHIWQHYPPHPLQEQEPQGDRKWIEKFPRLKKMEEFEDLIGVKFMHIRLLARAFTDRSIGFNNLTLGSNQRLEFLGDTVLQLIASEYLYRHFPEHHEGHLSLLRSSLVNNRTQAVVCTDLGMTQYAAYSELKTEIKMKDRADLLEALIGALYVDKGLEFCRKFCDVCFFPRLQLFILNQDWNDPKSKLQQCCLTLRNMESSEPEIPFYKVIECMGPTNTRVFTVAVYFRGERLAKASGHSIQMAEMNAASKALQNRKTLFPQLDHQHRVIAKSIRIQTKKLKEHYGADVTSGSAMFEQIK